MTDHNGNIDFTGITAGLIGQRMDERRAAGEPIDAIDGIGYGLLAFAVLGGLYFAFVLVVFVVWAITNG
jgi:hypothetical protein